MMEELENILNLESKYVSLRKNTPWESRDGDEVRAYHEWYDAAYRYFSRFSSIVKTEFYQTFEAAHDETGNCFCLEHVYDRIHAPYLVLVDKIKESVQDEKHLTNCEEDTIWSIMHPVVVEVAKQRVLRGFYADAVEAAFKEINVRVKTQANGFVDESKDGASLMQKVFSPEKPIIDFRKDTSQSEKDVQQGYMFMFSGAMSGIRNPKAHANEHIEIDDAYRKLAFASMLMYKLDEGKKNMEKSNE